MDSNYSLHDDGRCFDFGPAGQKPMHGEPGQSREEPWYAVLSVNPGAGPGEIRSAYHAALRAYHPDLVTLLGPKIRKVAADETRRIIRAYKQARSICE